ncbi:MAG TPA: vitamin K epoxide reductase family protein [Pyrinomonadaceae bacterium]|nr:vitamin K epoxide reductase family protein [Pyrinomonadaceae bacterium]
MSKPHMADVAATPQSASAQAIKRATVLYALAAVVALVGIGDTIYLTVEHLSGRSAQCVVTSGCSKVLSSPYASPGGVPLAVIGAAAYFTVFSLATLAAFGYRQAGRALSVIVALMFLTTLVLLYLQAFVIREFCDYCLLSALLIFTLTIITGALWRLRAAA